MILRSKMVTTTITVIGAIAVVLSCAFFMFYAQANGFQSQLYILDAEKSQLESQVNNLQIQNADLQSQIDSFEAEVAQLQNRIDSVEAENAQMQHQVDQLKEERDCLVDMLFKGLAAKYPSFGCLIPE